jgi:hypothetical protein
MSFRLVAAAVLAAGLSSPGRAGTIYVDDDNCPGPGSGSEADPYCSIQTAIDSAADADEIVVGPGVYHETIDLLGKAITLRSANGAAETVLDATGLGGAVVMCVHDEGPQTVLRGLTITGGEGYDPPPPNYALGGGLHVSYASPTVIDCVFRGNAAFRGGGLYGDFSDLTLSGCVLMDNFAVLGGGVLFEGGGAPVLDKCKFIDNLADLHGGALTGYNADITMTDCLLSENSGDNGGGIVVLDGVVRLDRCRLIGNLASTAGGAIYVGDDPVFEMVNCDVSYNTGYLGGGIYNTSMGSKLVNCTMLNNVGHAIWADYGSFTLVNCIVWGNTLGLVGGHTDDLTVFYSAIEGEWTGPGSNNIDDDPALADDLFGSWTGDPVYDAVTGLTMLVDDSVDFGPECLVGRRIVPDASLEALQTVVVANTATTITVAGEV